MVNLINLDLVQGGGPPVQHGGGSIMVGADFSSWDQPDGEELRMIRKESRAHAVLKGEGGHSKDSLTSPLNSVFRLKAVFSCLHTIQ